MNDGDRDNALTVMQQLVGFSPSPRVRAAAAKFLQKRAA